LAACDAASATAAINRLWAPALGDVARGRMMAEDAAPFTSGSSFPPSVFELFIAFSKVSLSGFGGVLPWARRVIVEQRAWMNANEFNEALALCQFLPGPNVVNFSILFGSRAQGVPGAVASFAGLLGPPVMIVLALGMLYERFGGLEPLRHMLAGMAAAAAGLIVATAGKMGLALLRQHSWSAALAASAALILVGVAGCPLPVALLFLVPCSIGLAWWRRR
jgi:chromate transporter